MNTAWLDQWLKEQASVLRRSKADVQKSAGGGNATQNDLVQYLKDRADGPFTLLEISDYYVIVRDGAPKIRVYLGTPTLAYGNEL